MRSTFQSSCKNDLIKFKFFIAEMLSLVLVRVWGLVLGGFFFSKSFFICLIYLVDFLCLFLSFLENSQDLRNTV